MLAVKVKRQLMVMVCVLTAAYVGAQDAQRAQATDLSVWDARILIYLSPASKQVRKAGFDVILEQARSPNEGDYYMFQVLSTGPCKMCSANVGYFLVNKHTADVRKMDDAERFPFITNRELAGVQRIMRGAHRITSEVIERYRDSSVW